MRDLLMLLPWVTKRCLSLPLLVFFFLWTRRDVVECTLDITVSSQEMQKLFFGNNEDIKIVENGNITEYVKDNTYQILPPINAKYSELMFNFASANRLYYRMDLRSSDTSIMSTPTVTIPYRGRLQKDWIAFKIRFPCTKLKTGRVKLEIILDFFYNRKNTDKYKSVNLTLSRECKAAKQSTQRHTNPYPTPGCRKRCDLKNFKRKMCLSDFVARVKITKALLSDNEKEPRYLAHIPRKRIFKKPVSFTMIKKNQVIRVHGPAVTCNCKPMEEGKKYLLFGREDIFNRVVYVDNYSIAFEIPSKRSNNVASNIIKRFKREYRSIRCPPKFTRNYGNTNSVIRHK